MVRFADRGDRLPRNVRTTSVEATNELSWTSDPHMAATYAKVRARKCYLTGREGGRPWLFEARVREAAILYVIDSARGGGKRQPEVSVYYEALPPSAFKDFNPLASAAERLTAIDL